jgi:hypothetical protein
MEPRRERPFSHEDIPQEQTQSTDPALPAVPEGDLTMTSFYSVIRYVPSAGPMSELTLVCCSSMKARRSFVSRRIGSVFTTLRVKILSSYARSRVKHPRRQGRRYQSPVWVRRSTFHQVQSVTWRGGGCTQSSSRSLRPLFSHWVS